jgi:hypothetical protein
VNSDDSRGNGLLEDSDEERDRKTFVGQAFVEVMYKMEKVYGDYCKNHDNAVGRLQTLEKNPGVAIWLRVMKKLPQREGVYELTVLRNANYVRKILQTLGTWNLSSSNRFKGY